MFSVAEMTFPQVSWVYGKSNWLGITTRFQGNRTMEVLFYIFIIEVLTFSTHLLTVKAISEVCAT